MKRKRFAKRRQRVVAAGLWPTVGIHVRVQTTVGTAVNVGTAAKDSLRERDFHIGVAPILSPLVDELQLAIAQQNRTRNIYAGWIIVWVLNVIGTRSLLGNSTRRAGLEFAVLQDREVDVAPIQVGVIDTDALADLVRIGGIRQVAGLGAFHLLDIDTGLGISTIGSTGQRRYLSALAPEVRLADVVIIRQTNRGTVLDDRPEVTTELEPRRVVTVVVVDLVA